MIRQMYSKLEFNTDIIYNCNSNQCPQCHHSGLSIMTMSCAELQCPWLTLLLNARPRRMYRHAAIVMWPAKRHVANLYRRGPSAVISALRTMLSVPHRSVNLPTDESAAAHEPAPGESGADSPEDESAVPGKPASCDESALAGKVSASRQAEPEKPACDASEADEDASPPHSANPSAPLLPAAAAVQAAHLAQAAWDHYCEEMLTCSGGEPAFVQLLAEAGMCKLAEKIVLHLVSLISAMRIMEQQSCFAKACLQQACCIGDTTAALASACCGQNISSCIRALCLHICLLCLLFLAACLH